MKPKGNAPGTPFNFDAIPVWIFPDLWDETKEIRFRGFWFVVLYTLSVLVFFGLFILLISIAFSKQVAVIAWVWLFLGIPGGIIYGLANWWDFNRLRKVLSLEKPPQSPDVKSQEPPLQ